MRTEGKKTEKKSEVEDIIWAIILPVYDVGVWPMNNTSVNL